MKKRILLSILMLLVVMTLMLTFTSCKSKEERALEEAQANAAAAERNLELAEEKYAETNSLIEEYEYWQQVIPTLPEGSAEKENAIRRNNEVVRQLMNEYPELSQYVDVN